MSEGMGIHSRDEVALKSAMERFVDARVRGLAELIRSDSQALRRMIEEKTRLIQLLDDYMSGDALTIVIGSEHHWPDLQRFSLIACRYTDGHGTGAVGVIGPTRMRYSRAINAVEGLSRAISRMVSTRS